MVLYRPVVTVARTGYSGSWNSRTVLKCQCIRVVLQFNTPFQQLDGTGRSSLCGDGKYRLDNTFDVFPLICLLACLPRTCRDVLNH